MKSLIIDDERLARDELRRLLSAHPEIEILGEAANATEALARIAELKPELLFLDISMPGRTGCDLLEALPPPHPLAIFGKFLLKGAFKELLRRTDPAEYGGAPLLGVNGVAHGTWILRVNINSGTTTSHFSHLTRS